MYPETGNMEKKVIGKGIRLNKGESALDAMKKRVPHWIHDKKMSTTSMVLYIYQDVHAQNVVFTHLEKRMFVHTVEKVCIL